MATANSVIGTVTALQGHAYIQHADGSKSPLKLGDVVHEGDVVVTDAGASVELSFANGHSLIAHQNETLTLDSSVFASDLPDAQSAAILQVLNQSK